MDENDEDCVPEGFVKRKFAQREIEGIYIKAKRTLALDNDTLATVLF